MGPIPTKKKVDFRLPRQGPKEKLLSPGVPCVLPPVVSDSEDDDDYARDNYDLAPVPIPDFDAQIHHLLLMVVICPDAAKETPGPPPTVGRRCTSSDQELTSKLRGGYCSIFNNCRNIAEKSKKMQRFQQLENQAMMSQASSQDSTLQVTLAEE